MVRGKTSVREASLVVTCSSGLRASSRLKNLLQLYMILLPPNTSETLMALEKSRV